MKQRFQRRYRFRIHIDEHHESLESTRHAWSGFTLHITCIHRTLKKQKESQI